MSKRTSDEQQAATRAYKLRKKASLTREETAWLKNYSATHRSKYSPKAASPTIGNRQAAPDAPGSTIGASPMEEPPPKPVEVHTELPGVAGTDWTPPPITVDATSTASTTPGGFFGPSDTSGVPKNGPTSSTSTGPNPSSAYPPPPPHKPAMDPKAAAATGKMVADFVTKVATEFNAFNQAHGTFFLKEPGIFEMFHFSVARLVTKYGSEIDEDTYDFTVVGGVVGAIGYGTWRAYLAEADATLPHEQAAAKGDSTHAAPSAGSATAATGPVSVGNTNGASTHTVGRALATRPRRQFDPAGIF